MSSIVRQLRLGDSPKARDTPFANCSGSCVPEQAAGTNAIETGKPNQKARHGVHAALHRASAKSRHFAHVILYHSGFAV